ncbi:gamma-glutamyl-gamma-aminobutyrate hydrolase family protein [Coleofasciculus sp. FACHB-SPT9]|uniref:gamma-glutamyl-gamma-aminobutyrate hydrolase family protein n=1 Tax=Cyanophyceae TaxID=3028117 RepID=UPI0016890F5C|nr:gamma-glutamyl-gamma-aminobutyrate hydrolase family protein [Coleofasciculus sp. FACHB-SPT9]MBD1890671.1 gamma-glutamyl-gamma-aminobutyrate hydrolase family protein [Coleofasciculus sp. FACHB-SPT9]
MKSKPPLIGITTAGQLDTRLFSIRGDYVEAVRLAGGLPMLLPPGEPDPAAILERIDGLIFSGGGDIDPAVYNDSSHPTVYNVDHQRDTFELALAKLVLDTDIPVLGICRGLEILVVATGGNLVQHLPDEFGDAIAHRTHQSRFCEHHVQIDPDSRLAAMIGITESEIVSWHHQAVRTVPPGWRVTARASDGVIEAMEHKQHPWAIALQWHPELALQDPYQQRIFQALVETARKRTI